MVLSGVGSPALSLILQPQPFKRDKEPSEVARGVHKFEFIEVDCHRPSASQEDVARDVAAVAGTIFESSFNRDLSSQFLYQRFALGGEGPSERADHVRPLADMFEESFGLDLIAESWSPSVKSGQPGRASSDGFDLLGLIVSKQNALNLPPFDLLFDENPHRGQIRDWSWDSELRSQAKASLVYPLHRDEGVSPVDREQLRDDALPPAIGFHADIEDAAIVVESQHLETDFVEGPLACPCREEMLKLGPELLGGKDRGEL